MPKVFQVVVHGSVFFESTDELVADAYAFYTKVNWKDVKVIPKIKHNERKNNQPATKREY